MKVIEPSFYIRDEDRLQQFNKIKAIANAARVCYQSAENSGKTDDDMVSMIIANQHFAMLEHGGTVTVNIICDRGISHELVRHREASFAQESTRYCNYSKGKFGSDVTVIRPIGFGEKTPEWDIWYDACAMATESYMDLLDKGVKPQMARSVLPNSTKTEIVITANLREWRHIFGLRCAFDAHPQMRQIMLPLLEHFYGMFPVVFYDLYDVYGLKRLKLSMIENNATDAAFARSDMYYYHPNPEVYAEYRIDLLYDTYLKGVQYYGSTRIQS